MSTEKNKKIKPKTNAKPRSSDSHHNMTVILLTETGPWWALNWFHSSIRMVVFGPSSTKFHRGNAFSWHMLWHPYNWASCQHTTPAKPECNMESERDVTASRESLKIDKCRVLASLHPLVCVCISVLLSQSSCQHQTIRGLTPCRPRRSPACEGMGTLRGGKTGSYSRRTWFNSLRHTHMSAYTHICSVVVRGFTSPRPEQRSVLNFDPSHYLPRRWGLDWGDNLWTLTFNPEQASG